MMKKQVDFDDIKNSEDVKTYISLADESLTALGYTEHSFAHVTKCAMETSSLLEKLGYGRREVELAKIAGYMHDIGNVINRNDHAQSSAVMAFTLLNKMGMGASEIATVVTAIGNHDEGTAFPVSAIAAALILADKTDVRRSRVRNHATINFDIHDRVNYAVEESSTHLDKTKKTFTLTLKINSEICSVMDYFEIFLQRMLLCRKAADYFGLEFKLNVNGLDLL